MSEPEFHGILVLKFKNIVGNTDFLEQFTKYSLLDVHSE